MEAGMVRFRRPPLAQLKLPLVIPNQHFDPPRRHVTKRIAERLARTDHGRGGRTAAGEESTQAKCDQSYFDPRLKRMNEGASLRAATRSSLPSPSRSPAAIPYIAPNPSPTGRASNFLPVPSL